VSENALHSLHWLDFEPATVQYRKHFTMSNLPTKLNKSQQRDISKILVNGASLGDDYMARGLSALYRSAMKTSQQDEILAIALAYGVVSNNEFIV
jgi:hypothetical protein